MGKTMGKTIGKIIPAKNPIREGVWNSERKDIRINVLCIVNVYRECLLSVSMVSVYCVYCKYLL